MDLADVIKQRLEELNLDQRELAAAAKVTESYVSQLLNRRKPPPAPERTDIYAKLERSLRLPKGRLSGIAGVQRKEEVKRAVLDPPAPLFQGVRRLILRKCAAGRRDAVRAIFERQPFGEVERFVTQKLLDVVKSLAMEELENEDWLRRFAGIQRKSYATARVDILEFLDTDVFHVSDEDCVAFLEPFIESWDINLVTFALDVQLNRRLGPTPPRRFEFLEVDSGPRDSIEPGLQEFFADGSLSGDVTEEEAAFLKRLRFGGRRPTPMYFYREVQSLRDALHFRAPQVEPRGGPEGRRTRKKTTRASGTASRRPTGRKSSSP